MPAPLRIGPLRIGFFGLPLAAHLLARDGHRLEWAVLSPVVAPGRRRVSSLIEEERMLDLLFDDAAWQRHVSDLVRRHPVDLIVSWFFTRRIAGDWIAASPNGAIGAHPSLLPRYRGPDPFFAVIDAGEPITGVTVHRLTEEYDRGAILAQRTLAIGQRNAWQLARALDRPSLALLREVTQAFALGRPPRAQEQDESQVTWAPEPDAEGRKVNWSWSSERVLRRIRALAPVPGLALELGDKQFIVLSARPTTDCPTVLAPGEAHIGRRLALRTGDGAIEVEKASICFEGEPLDALDGAGLVDFLRS
jgi:methionyl-tRNA formyltransferase